MSFYDPDDPSAGIIVVTNNWCDFVECCKSGCGVDPDSTIEIYHGWTDAGAAGWRTTINNEFVCPKHSNHEDEK